MLRGAWLGDWPAPWGLDRGRRWGDPAWALAGTSQAWLLGGSQGRWPQLQHEARRATGPRVLARPTAFALAHAHFLRLGARGCARSAEPPDSIRPAAQSSAPSHPG